MFQALDRLFCDRASCQKVAVSIPSLDRIPLLFTRVLSCYISTDYGIVTGCSHQLHSTPGWLTSLTATIWNWSSSCVSSPTSISRLITSRRALTKRMMMNWILVWSRCSITTKDNGTNRPIILINWFSSTFSIKVHPLTSKGL